MKSNGGVLSADEVVHQPITTVLSGPGGRCARRRADRQGRRLRPGADLRRRRHLDRRRVVIDGEPTLTTEGSVGRVPVQDPDDRRRHRRRRRRLDRLALARRAPSRSARGRPAPTPARSATARAAPSVTITDAHVVLGRIPPHLLGGEIPLDVDAARAGLDAARRQARPQPGGLRHRHPGDLGLEPGQRAAPGHRQARPRRPRLHAHHLRRLRLAAALPADGRPRPPDGAGAARTRATSRRSACSPSTSRTTTCRPTSPCTTRLDPADGRRRSTTTSPARRPTALAKEGFGRASTSFVRTADLRYFGQAFEVRVPVPRRAARPRTPRRGRRPPSTPSTGRCTATTSPATRPAGRVGQPAGLRHRADPAPRDQPQSRASRRRCAASRAAPAGRSASTPPTGTSTRRALAHGPGPGRPVDRPGDHRGVRLHGADPSRLRRPGRRVPATSSSPGPTGGAVDRGRQQLPRASRRAPTQFPFGHADRGRRCERRPGAGRDRAGLAGQRREGGRDRHRRAPAAAR